MLFWSGLGSHGNCTVFQTGGTGFYRDRAAGCFGFYQRNAPAFVSIALAYLVGFMTGAVGIVYCRDNAAPANAKLNIFFHVRAYHAVGIYQAGSNIGHIVPIVF